MKYVEETLIVRTTHKMCRTKQWSDGARLMNGMVHLIV